MDRARARLIGAHEGVRAGDLADELGLERLAFKADVRKLKALGLTESLASGTGSRRVARPGSTVIARVFERGNHHTVFGAGAQASADASVAAGDQRAFRDGRGDGRAGGPSCGSVSSSHVTASARRSVVAT